VQGSSKGKFVSELFGSGHEGLRLARIELRLYTAELVVEWLLLLDRQLRRLSSRSHFFPFERSAPHTVHVLSVLDVLACLVLLSLWEIYEC
jgi:hypothetical protein